MPDWMMAQFSRNPPLVQPGVGLLQTSYSVEKQPERSETFAQFGGLIIQI